MSISCKETCRVLAATDLHADHSAWDEVELHLQSCSRCMRMFEAATFDYLVDRRLDEANQVIELPTELRSLQNDVVQGNLLDLKLRLTSCDADAEPASLPYLANWKTPKVALLLSLTAALLLALALPMWSGARNPKIDISKGDRTANEPLRSERHLELPQDQSNQQNQDQVGDSSSNAKASEVDSTSSNSSYVVGRSKELSIQRPIVRGRNGYTAVDLSSGEDEIPFLLLLSPNN